MSKSRLPFGPAAMLPAVVANSPSLTGTEIDSSPWM